MCETLARTYSRTVLGSFFVCNSTATAEKQWDETATLTLQGVARVMRHGMWWLYSSVEATKRVFWGLHCIVEQGSGLNLYIMSVFLMIRNLEMLCRILFGVIYLSMFVLQANSSSMLRNFSLILVGFSTVLSVFCVNAP